MNAIDYSPIAVVLPRPLHAPATRTILPGADYVEVTAPPREDGAQPRTVTFPANQPVSMPSTLAPIVEQVIANTRSARHARARRR
jgi:hypothetical protein